MNEPQVAGEQFIPLPHLFNVPKTTPLDPAPRLENGDHLTRAEFERRYDAMPNLKKAELIKGVVYMSPPVRHKKHSRPNGNVLAWLIIYAAATPGVDYGVNGTVRLDEDNEPQPDALLFLPQELGGQSHIDDDDYIAGSPELIVEIAASTASYDLHEKKDSYQQHGVAEYIVWRTEDRALDWFRLQDGQDVELTPNHEGIIESQIFPGLRLAINALLVGDLARVLAELQKGLASAEHAAFRGATGNRANTAVKRNGGGPYAACATDCNLRQSPISNL